MLRIDADIWKLSSLMEDDSRRGSGKKKKEKRRDFELIEKNSASWGVKIIDNNSNSSSSESASVMFLGCVSESDISFFVSRGCMIYHPMILTLPLRCLSFESPSFNVLVEYMSIPFIIIQSLCCSWGFQNPRDSVTRLSCHVSSSNGWAALTGNLPIHGFIEMQSVYSNQCIIVSRLSQ